MGKRKNQLTISDRYSIEIGISKNQSLCSIAHDIDKDPACLYREVKRNRTIYPSIRPYGNDCKYYKICSESFVCGDTDCTYVCKRCSEAKCTDFCDEYVSDSCKKPSKSPYVCNTCSQVKNCIDEHYLYFSKLAQKNADMVRSSSRAKIHLKDESLKDLDRIISAGIKKGQPISHIVTVHRDEIPVTERTIYNYVERRVLSVRNLDLRRKVGYKKRKKKASESLDLTRIQEYRKNRSYEDFRAFMANQNHASVVEMDTVKGAKNTRACFLTMLFRTNNIMLIFPMPDCRQESVLRVLDFLQEGLGLERFQRVFRILLTDNGSEFKDVEGIEFTAEKVQRTNVFYCDPMASWQKGRLEKNHEYIRYVIPKGSNLGLYSLNDTILLMNHINSTIRSSLGYFCPYDLIKENDSDMLALMELLNLKKINPSQVELTPELLQK